MITHMALRRGARVMLVLMSGAVVVSIGGMLALYALVSRWPTVPQSSTLVLRLGGELSEVARTDVVGQLLGGEGNTVRTFVDSLHKAKRDSRISSVLLMP